MNRKVAVVAAAQTRYAPARPDARVQELVWEVVKKVLEDTSLCFEEGTGIDHTVTCSDDMFDARTISDAPLGDLVGAHLRSEEKVSQDGLQALFYAYATILSGHYDIVLVTAHCKESQPASRNLITNTAFDPIFTRRVGLDYLSASALQARTYMDRYGIHPDAFAEVIVKNIGCATNNPNAHQKGSVCVSDVLGSPMVADPLHAMEVYPVSDGACAVILACEEKASDITERPVWILGAANCYDSFFLGDRDLARPTSLEKAARRAYEMAGITDPAQELDVIEISAQFSYQELLWSEGLGLCTPGKGAEMLRSGRTYPEGDIPVSPSGGMFGGNPLFVAGLARAAELFLQLREEAGERQASLKTGKALAHGITGPCGQLQTVMIFAC